MKLRCASVFILLGAAVSGCAPVAPPLTPSAIRENVLQQSWVNQCIQNGWGNVPSLVAFRTRVIRNLGNTTQDQINAQAAFIDANGGVAKVSQSNCRSIEANGYKIAEDSAKLDRQIAARAAARAAEPWPTYQPRYTNCTNYAGITNCVNY